MNFIILLFYPPDFWQKTHAKLGTFLNTFFSLFLTKKFPQLVNSRKKPFPFNSAHKWGHPQSRECTKKNANPLHFYKGKSILGLILTNPKRLHEVTPHRLSIKLHWEVNYFTNTSSIAMLKDGKGYPLMCIRSFHTSLPTEIFTNKNRKLWNNFLNQFWIWVTIMC